MPEIFFIPLQSTHFPLLLKWLEAPHLKTWWDQDIRWTPELIQEKYGTYTQGYKAEKGIKKPLQAYIIYIANVPIGYIQFYNAYHFPRENGDLPEGLPKNLAALDFYIGDPDYVGKGIGSLILNKFLKDHIQGKFEACFVDPDPTNQWAIRAYEKAGFQFIFPSSQGDNRWMIKPLNEHSV